MKKFDETINCRYSVAILLATYNGTKFIEEQLESIAGQTYQDFMCYIHDDGSTDDTVEKVNLFCRNHTEHFCFIGSDRVFGAKNNFIYLLSHITAPYIMFSDQDDVWMPEKVKISMDNMKLAENKVGGGSPYLFKCKSC